MGSKMSTNSESSEAAILKKEHPELVASASPTTIVKQTKKARKIERDVAWMAFRDKNLWSNTRARDISLWKNCNGREMSQAQKHGGWSPVNGKLLKAERELVAKKWKSFKEKYENSDVMYDSDDICKLWHTRLHRGTVYSNYEKFGWSPHGRTFIIDDSRAY